MIILPTPGLQLFATRPGGRRVEGPPQARSICDWVSPLACDRSVEAILVWAKLAPVKSAPARLAAARFAPIGLAFLKLARSKWPWVRLAPNNAAPTNWASRAFTRVNSEPSRFA